MLVLYFLTGVFIFALAYRCHGSFLDHKLNVSDDRVTPANLFRDDIDFVPTQDPVLFGHHFSSIAGAGPIVGPVVAGLAFGWLPAALWVVLGSIFVGGVHDYMAMIAGVRHGGKSIAEIYKDSISRPIYFLFLVFIIFTLIYVIIVFLDLTAAGFAPDTKDPFICRQGGAVATASLLYILLALAFGITVYKRGWTLKKASLIYVPLVFVIIAAGLKYPFLPDYLPRAAGSVKNFWVIVLLVYCFCASILPVWLLLQPRDYLSSFLLYACLLGGVLGLLAAGLHGQAVIAYPIFIGWHDKQLGLLFPALFITVACGAVSGFHAIVASGTSAKQLSRESSVRRIGYGGMLLEGVMALLALGTVMVLRQKTSENPVQVFTSGLGSFMGYLGLNPETAKTFVLLAVSTFLLTTLDTCTRLARFVVQEFFGFPSTLPYRTLTTIGVLSVPALVVFRQIPGANGVLMPAWQAVWPAFGASNQLLAALALLCGFLWLRRSKISAWFIGVPLVFMSVTSLWALWQMVWGNLYGQGSRFIGGVCLILGVLACLVIGAALKALLKKPS